MGIYSKPLPEIITYLLLHFEKQTSCLFLEWEQFLPIKLSQEFRVSFCSELGKWPGELWGAQITQSHPRGCRTSLCQLQLMSNQPLKAKHPPDLCPFWFWTPAPIPHFLVTPAHTHIKCCLYLSQVNYYTAQPSRYNTVSGVGQGTPPAVKRNFSLSPPAPQDSLIPASSMCFPKPKILYKGEHCLYLRVCVFSYTPWK